MFAITEKDIKSWDLPRWVFIATCILFIATCILFWEDMSTTKDGYAQLPTIKSNAELVSWAVAFLPQGLQIMGFYVFYQMGKNKQGYSILFMAVIALVFDVFTDVYFKSSGFNSTSEIIIATLESVSLYTIGSEILGPLTFEIVRIHHSKHGGEIANYVFKVIHETWNIIKRIFSGLANLVNTKEDIEQELSTPNKKRY